MKKALRKKMVFTVLAWLVAGLIFFPIFWMLLTGFQTEVEAVATPPSVFFRHTLENYLAVQQRADYFKFAWNSIVILLGSTLLGLLKHDYRMRDALLPHNCLYTVVECSAAGERARVIGSLLNFLYAPQDPQAAIEKTASPECRIVSLTITEGGYYVNQGAGEFDYSYPEIVHDLEHSHEPCYSFGYLAEALNRRRQCGLPPFTIMSCDNLPQNGNVAKKMILAFAERRDPALSRWLGEYRAFPNSMVDRITPATTEGHRVMVREKLGIDDAWPVITEPFKQWVIEDCFPNGRPPWEQVRAHMTSDVLPYEKIKIRLLNASHQAICHVGRLLGVKPRESLTAI